MLEPVGANEEKKIAKMKPHGKFCRWIVEVPEDRMFLRGIDFAGLAITKQVPMGVAHLSV